MSFDTMLMVAAVISMFVAFAGALIWADLHNRPARDKVTAYSRKRRAF
jgi:hypothetical protein